MNPTYLTVLFVAIMMIISSCGKTGPLYPPAPEADFTQALPRCIEKREHCTKQQREEADLRRLKGGVLNYQKPPHKPIHRQPTCIEKRERCTKAQRAAVNSWRLNGGKEIF